MFCNIEKYNWLGTNIHNHRSHLHNRRSGLSINGKRRNTRMGQE